MTAPLTPRNNQPPNEPPHHGRPSADDVPSPWAVPATDHGATAEDGGPGLARELREAALIALVVALCGLLLGALWNWLAPHTPLISDTKAVYLKNTEGEEAIAADGTFILLSLALGVLTAAAVFLLRRRGGVPLVVALALGGLLGALLGWRMGMWLGPTVDVAAHAKQVGPGVTFDGPLLLGMKGALLAWPVAATLTHLVLTALFGPADPQPAVYWPAAEGTPAPDGPPPSAGGPASDGQERPAPDERQRPGDERPPAS
ncbi:ABC transporter permease [Streptomyces gilvosporeus]|uniref:ABC transporter permease n=1 Tax=Streptomyces gilvosporeus TaxID=553510 RepID=UPI001F2EFB18|nr:ABC transporter permease [Streptomyces gilvosporeus]